MGKAAVKPQAELLEAAVALLRTAPRLGGDASAEESLLGGGGSAAATSVPQFLAFREAWLRQVREVLNDAPLFDKCFDTRTGEGVRAALAVMSGDETAVNRATPGGWLELMVASARHRYPQLKAHGEHASLAQRCVATKGPGHSADMDRLLMAVIEVNAAEAVGVCSHHLVGAVQVEVS
jgi:nuclear pore complex protein Nup85